METSHRLSGPPAPHLPSPLPLSPITGLQDSYLRTARELHDLDRLDDWVAYLRDTWAGPLYHDGFYDLALSLRNLLKRDEGQYTAVPKWWRMRGVCDEDRRPDFASVWSILCSSQARVRS